jgi:predicted transcriptional regulator
MIAQEARVDPVEPALNIDVDSKKDSTKDFVETYDKLRTLHFVDTLERPMTLPKPTDGELAILSVLWSLGPSTVRQVHEDLLRERDLGYTTVLKMLQVMTEKKLVVRDETERTHIYAPAQSQTMTQRTLVEDLLGRAFNGSALKLMVQALSASKSSPEELAEIRTLLDRTGGKP